MNHKRLPRNARCGAVLPLVILMVVVLMVIGIGLTGLSMHSRMLAVRSAADISARSAADAAVSTAVFQMNEKLKVKPWNHSSLPAGSDVELLDCNATFDYAVSENNNIYAVSGTGRAGNSVRTINSTLRLISPFDYALFARNTVELKNCAKVDWYNNKPGDWPLQVGTGSTGAGAITLMNGAIVNGDVVVGVDGDPKTVIENHGANFNDSYAMTSEPVLPVITVPAYLVSMPSGGQITDSTTISSSGKYSKIDLGHSKVLTINVPVTLYITGDVLLGNSAEIKINSGGSLVMYIGGNVIGDNSAGFNNTTADAKNLGIFCLDTCTKVLFKNSSNFYGTIYALDAAVTIDNSANIYGSVVSDSFILKNSGRLHYDAALRNRSVNDEAVRFAINRWSEQ